MGRFQSFFKELKRRNVYKVAIAYGITGWVIIQMGAIASNAFGAPPWVMKMIITVILLGLPIALIFAWAFELTGEGLKRTREVHKSESITHHTGRKLNYWIIGLLSAALVFILIANFWFGFSFSSNVNTALAKDPEPSIAVLPFEDFSRGNNEWFSDGLTEALLNTLARHPGFKVAARTSSFYFKDKSVPIQKIADTLDVNYVVEGSVRLADSTMRITAQLIRASNGYHLWSKTYSREMQDVFKIQKDIAENIAAALDIYLDGEAREEMFAFGTRDVRAYNAYLKGRKIYDELHKGALDSMALFKKANPLFKKAVQFDPGFAAPYYYLSDSYLHYILQYQRFQVDTLAVNEAREQMLSYFDKAIANAENPGLELMYELEKTYLSNYWGEIPELVKQLKNSQKAQRAYTMLGGGWTRNLLNYLGYARLQYRLSKQAAKRDPLDHSLEHSQIQAMMSFAPLDSVLKALNEHRRGTFFSEFLLFLRAGKFSRADSMVAIIAAIPDTTDVQLLNILIKASKGNLEQARKSFKTFQEKRFKESSGAAIIYYALGKKEKANSLTVAIDTTALGPLKLLTLSNLAGFMPFEPMKMPNLGDRFREAGVEVGSLKVGAVYFPAIIQKGLETNTVDDD